MNSDNRGNYYAMYSAMKGFRLFGIDSLTYSGTKFSWYAHPTLGYAQWLVDRQYKSGWADGLWPQYYGYNLTTAWAILILQPTVVEPGPIADAGVDVGRQAPDVDITLDAAGSYHLDCSGPAARGC